MFFSHEQCVGQLTAQLFITQFQCYYNVIIVNQSSAKNRLHVSVNKTKELNENELDYSILHNSIKVKRYYDYTMSKGQQFQVSCTERKGYINVFSWSLDFVTHLNNFLEVLVF